jgi:dihydrofolate reductase
MGRLVVFEQISLDGYFKDQNDDMSWAKQGAPDEELMSFTERNAQQGGILVFGRLTYDLMASFWPTAQAKAAMPVVAAGMNERTKVVFSRTMKEAAWNNTRVINGDLLSEIKKLKEESGPGVAILGSGSLVAQLAPHRVIDEYQVIVNPIALGAGKTMFDGIKEQLHLRLVKSKVFKNGKVFLSYEPE